MKVASYMTNEGSAATVTDADGGKFVVRTSTDGGASWSSATTQFEADPTAHFPGLLAADAGSFSAVWGSDTANSLVFQKFTVT